MRMLAMPLNPHNGLIQHASELLIAFTAGSTFFISRFDASLYLSEPLMAVLILNLDYFFEHLWVTLPQGC